MSWEAFSAPYNVNVCRAGREAHREVRFSEDAPVLPDGAVRAVVDAELVELDNLPRAFRKHQARHRREAAAEAVRNQELPALWYHRLQNSSAHVSIRMFVGSPAEPEVKYCLMCR